MNLGNLKTSILAETAFFTDISPKDLEQLADLCELRSWDSGDILFHAGQRADGFYVVIEGEIEVYRATENLREHIIHQISEGELCGEVPLFSGGTYPACARARGNLRALYVPGGPFFELVRANPDILLEMLAVLGRRLRRFVDLIADLSLKDVQARLADYLLQLRKSQSSDLVVLDASKREIASRLGTIQETLSRALAKFRNQEIIAIEGKKIEIIDPKKLRSIAMGNA